MEPEIDVPIEVARRRSVSFRREDLWHMSEWELVDAWNELRPERKREAKFPTKLFARRKILERLELLENGELEVVGGGPPINPPAYGDPSRKHKIKACMVKVREPRPGSLEILRRKMKRRTKQGTALRILCSPKSMTVGELAERMGWTRLDVIQVLYMIHRDAGIGSREDPDGKLRILALPGRCEEGALRGVEEPSEEAPQGARPYG